jgi:hypothetical protein
MIVYTPAAASWAEGSGGINNVISQAIQKSKNAHANSGTGVDINLVHSAQINYTEAGSGTDLNRLTFSDGYMDEVLTWRDTYGADLVCILTYTSDTGGLGWLYNGSSTYGMCLSRVQQTSWTYTLVHEFGHNMGCGHRADQATQPGPGYYSYSSGWHWTGSSGSKHASVMSYEDGGYYRVAHFSNPSISYDGVATGNATTGDNARSMRNIKPNIAAFRASISQDPEIAVKFGTTEIADGDSTPSTAEGTDFGICKADGSFITRTFTIANSGDGDLELDGSPKVQISGTNAADFEVTTLPASPIANGSTTSFAVKFTPSATGLRQASISISNNDTDENPYNFAIQGSGNDIPVAVAGLDTTDPAVGIDIYLSGINSLDPDGDDITTYSWVQDSGPAVTLDTTTPSNPFFTPTETGTYVFTLTVTDENGFASTDQSSPDNSVTVEVLEAFGAPTVIPFPDPVTDATPTITWTTVTGADKYNIKIYDLVMKSWAIDEVVTTTSFTPTEDLFGSSYQIHVRAGTSSGTWSELSTKVILTLDSSLTVPVLTQITTPTTDLTPTFTWTEITNASKYNIKVYDFTTKTWIIDEEVTTTSYTPADELFGDNYQAIVKAGNDSGSWGNWSNKVIFEIDKAVLVPVLTQVATPTADLTPTFTWTAATGATKYNLKVYDINAKVWVIDEEITSTSYTPAQDLFGDKYQALVRASDGSSWTPWSNKVIFEIDKAVLVPVLTPLPPVITDLTPEFTWTTATGATEYNIKVYDFVAKVWVIDEVVVETSYTPTENLFGEKYQALVRAGNGSGAWTNWSNKTIFEIDKTVLVPTLTALPSVVNDLTPEFTWTAATGATKYNIRVYDFSSASWVVNEEVTGTSYTPAQNLFGDRFQAIVRAGDDSGGWSSWSNKVIFTLDRILLTTSITQLITPVVDRTPNITWTPIAGATKYNVKIYNTVTKIWEVNKEVTGTTFTPTTDLTGDYYQAIVKAGNDNGSWATWSNKMNFNF